MRLQIADWDIEDSLIPKGEKSNVVKWNELLNSEIAKKAFDIVRNDILSLDYSGSDLPTHALKNAERQGMIKVLRKIYDLGSMPKTINQDIGEPWGHIKPEEE